MGKVKRFSGEIDGEKVTGYELNSAEDFKAMADALDIPAEKKAIGEALGPMFDELCAHAKIKIIHSWGDFVENGKSDFEQFELEYYAQLAKKIPDKKDNVGFQNTVYSSILIYTTVIAINEVKHMI